MALLQAGLLFLNFFQKEIPLPTTLAERVFKKIQPYGLEAEWGSVVFDLRGGLLLSDFSLKRSISDELITSAEEARVQWSPLSIVLPFLFPLDEVEIRRAQVYLPARYTRSGLNEPVLYIHEATLNESGGFLNIENLHLQIQNLHFQINGSGALSALMRKKDEGGQINWDPLRSLDRIPPDLRLFIDLDWQGLSSNQHQLQANVLLPKLAFSDYTITRTIIQAQANWENNQLSISSGTLSGYLTVDRLDIPSLDFLETALPSTPRLFQLDLSGPLTKLGNWYLPKNAHAQVNLNPKTPLFKQLNIQTTLSPGANSIHCTLNGSSGFVSGSANVSDWMGPAMDITLLQAQANLKDAALHDFFDTAPGERLLQNIHADSIRLNAQIDPTEKHLNGICVTDGLAIGDTHFAHIYTHIEASPSDLNFPEIHATKSSGESAQGAYFHHLPSSQFTLLANGAIFPQSLNYLLGNWWIEIFKQIHAQTPIGADVAVWGK